MRDILWRHYLRVFQPGERVLDVSCGTGLDAVMLARAGIAVTAVDVSPGMIRRCSERVARAGLTGMVETQVLNAANLDRLQGSGAPPFDGILSAFAGVSTLPDLESFARDAARLLRPGGHLIVHMLNRWSLWEWLGLLWSGRWRDARDLVERTQRDFTIGGVPVRHYLYFPLEAHDRCFASCFELRQAYGLGALRPPHTVSRVPAPLVAWLEAAEPHLGAHRPWLNRGRFFVLDLVPCPVLPP